MYLTSKMFHQYNLLTHRDRTYPEYGRVIRHSWPSVLLCSVTRRCDYVQLLHIAAAEDNVLVDVLAARNLLGRVAFATFCAVGGDRLEGDSVGFAVDLVECANVLDVGLGDERDTAADIFRHRG